MACRARSWALQVQYLLGAPSNNPSQVTNAGYLSLLMEHQPHSDDEAIRRLVESSNTIFPKELRARAYADATGTVAWRIDDAEEAIRTLEAAGAAIMAGTLWAVDKPDERPRVTVEVDGETRSHGWHCPQEAAEVWSAFVKRSAVAARSNLAEAARLVRDLVPRYKPYIRFSWITEEQGRLFDLPPIVRRMSDEASARGDLPWGHIDWPRNVLGVDVRRGCSAAPGSFYAGSSARRLREVPGHTAFLRVDAKTEDLDRLTDLEGLDVLQFQGVGPRELAIIGRVSSIRFLSLEGVRATNLDALADLDRLEHLRCIDSGTLVSLHALTGLNRLRTLGLSHLRRLDYFADASRLTQLWGLAASGSMWSHARVRSLAPLRALRNLRSLHISGVRVADELLSPLTALDRLHALTVSNWFIPEEFAELAAAFPNLDPGYRSMWWVPPQPANPGDYNACKSCKASTRGMTIGKPMKQFCPHCHEAKIAKFAAHWEVLVDAAEHRRRARTGA